MELHNLLDNRGDNIQDKQNLRKIFGKKRAALTKNEVEELSQKVLFQFKKLEISDVHYVQSFIPSQKLIEPDALLLVDYLKKMNKSLIVAAPSINRADYSMESVVISDEPKFKKNGLGISEPLGTEILNPEMLDLILIPLVCFDVDGNRVGHGKGYYDRYLKRCRKDALKVGVSLFEPVSRVANVSKNDVRMDVCCTPQNIYCWK